MQLVDSFLRPLAELADGAKLNRLRRAGLGAGRLQPALHPVVAQRALLRGPRHRIDVNHAEGTRRNAGAAAIAGVRLNHDRVELGADDCARGTNLEAPGLDAVFAHIAHQQPAPVAAVLAELLDELDVAPMD